jgi:hypothetical protein
MASAWVKLNPLSAQTATRFLKPLRSECGAEEAVGTPISRARAVCIPMALLNLERMTLVERSRTAASKIYSFWRIFVTFILYSKG